PLFPYTTLFRSGDAAADGGRHSVRTTDRAYDGRDRRRAARHDYRPDADARLLCRRVRPAIRRRSAAALCLRGQTRLVPHWRIRDLLAPGAALAHRRGDELGLVRADDALVDDRRAAAGLYPHRTRQGACTNDGSHPPRPAER